MCKCITCYKYYRIGIRFKSSASKPNTIKLIFTVNKVRRIVKIRQRTRGQV